MSATTTAAKTIIEGWRTKRGEPEVSEPSYAIQGRSKIAKTLDTYPSGLGAHTAYAARVASKHAFDNQTVKTAYQKCTWTMPS